MLSEHPGPRVSEAQRVAALHALAILDRPEDRDLSLIVRTAAIVCGAATATINLIDDEHQHQVAIHGANPTVCSRTVSMCAVTLAEDTPVQVADATTDPRFATNPFVTGALGRVRFYVAHQLWLAPGLPVGTLCVYDEHPRELTAAQTDALHDLAEQAAEVLRLRWRGRALDGEVDELHRSNIELSAFAATVAHDLRSPLAAQRWLLEMAQSGPGAQPAPRVHELIAAALSATTRMQALVTDMLRFAEVGADPVHAEVDLGGLLVDALADLPPNTQALVQAKTLPVVRTDPVKVRQLLANLLSNAVKYAQPEPAAPVHVRAGNGAGGWWLQVADHGPGIPVQERARIFAPFVRLSPATSQPGHGIGLATCLRSVTALGGVLGVDDTPGGGATFTASFPAALAGA